MDLSPRGQVSHVEEENQFDPKECEQCFDGWELYKRRKVPVNLVRKYCLTLDSDYCKHKITVCAHLGAIMDIFNFQRKPFMHHHMG